MKAASAASIESLLERLCNNEARPVIPAAATKALMLTKLRSAHVGFDQISRLSDAFLEDRRKSMQSVLGPQAYTAPEVDFIFFPVAPSIAATFIERGRASIFVSLGLLEVLRLGCAAGQLDSAITRLETDAALRGELGPEALGRMIESLRMMTQYFNGCAILHLEEPRQLPAVASLLDEQTKHRVDITLEAVLMFVLLHELGHVDYHRTYHAKDSGPSLVWELVVQEQLDEQKKQELYADRFALQSVPEAFALTLVHAATFFLHLHNYADATTGNPADSHPLGVNRIAALYALAKGTVSMNATGHRAVNQAVEAGTELWARSNPALPLRALSQVVERLSQVDWRPAQEALQLLANRPTVRVQK
jgi:hypothetical protein